MFNPNDEYLHRLEDKTKDINLRIPVSKLAQMTGNNPFSEPARLTTIAENLARNAPEFKGAFSQVPTSAMKAGLQAERLIAQTPEAARLGTQMKARSGFMELSVSPRESLSFRPSFVNVGPQGVTLSDMTTSKDLGAAKVQMSVDLWSMRTLARERADEMKQSLVKMGLAPTEAAQAVQMAAQGQLQGQVLQIPAVRDAEEARTALAAARPVSVGMPTQFSQMPGGREVPKAVSEAIQNIRRPENIKQLAGYMSQGPGVVRSTGNPNIEYQVGGTGSGIAPTDKAIGEATRIFLESAKKVEAAFSDVKLSAEELSKVQAEQGQIMQSALHTFKNYGIPGAESQAEIRAATERIAKAEAKRFGPSGPEQLPSDDIRGGQNNGLIVSRLLAGEVSRRLSPNILQSIMGEADVEDKQRQMLAQIGYGGQGRLNPITQAAASLTAMQRSIGRETAATWSPMVRDMSGMMNNPYIGEGASIYGPALAAGLGTASFMGLVPGLQPFAAPAGALVGIGTAMAGQQSREQYLKENPDYAAMTAYSKFATNGNAYSLEAMRKNPNFWTDLGLPDWKLPGQSGPSAKDLEEYKQALAAPGQGAEIIRQAQSPDIREQFKNLSKQRQDVILYALGQGAPSLGNQPGLPALMQQLGITDQAQFNQSAQWALRYGSGALSGDISKYFQALQGGIDVDKLGSAASGLFGGLPSEQGGVIEQFLGNPELAQIFASGAGSKYGAMSQYYAQSGGSEREDLTAKKLAAFGKLPEWQKQLAEAILSKSYNADQTARGMGANEFSSGNGIRNLIDREQLQEAARMAGQDIPAIDARNRLQAQMESQIGGGMALDIRQSLADSGVSLSGMNLISNAWGGNQNALTALGGMTGNYGLSTRESGTGLGMFTSTLNTLGRGMDPRASGIFNSASPQIKAALTGYKPMFGSQSYGGLWGLQSYMSDLSYQSQMASAGISLANVQRGWQFTSGQGLNAQSIYAGGQTPWGSDSIGNLAATGGQWGIQDKQLRLSRGQQDWQLGQQGASNALSYQQFAEGWKFNREQAQMQYGWQMQDFGLSRRGQIMQRGFTAQDFGFQSQDRNRQFGYQMEDYDFNVRYATGRERVQMNRQMKRDVTEHNIGEDRQTIMEDRQKKAWRLEDERYQIEVGRASAMFKLNEKKDDMELQHFKERDKLEKENMDRQRGWYDEQRKLEDQSIELERTRAKADMEAQKQAIGTQAGYATMLHQAETKAIELQREAEKANALLQKNFDLGGQFLVNLGDLIKNQAPLLDSYVKQLKGLLGTGGSGPRENERAGGFSGLVTQPTRMLVGEAGAEQVTVQPFGSFTHNSINNPGGTTGPITLNVYLDGKEISGHTVKQITNQVFQGRRR